MANTTSLAYLGHECLQVNIRTNLGSVRELTDREEEEMVQRFRMELRALKEAKAKSIKAKPLQVC